MTRNIPGQSKQRTIYIGRERFEELSRHVREINFLTESNIRHSFFLQFLMDEYIEKAREKLLQAINEQKEDAS